jgi:hypothetical protein|nr:MAG TPA: hypothetical protein [Caudoviricetes sp.]
MKHLFRAKDTIGELVYGDVVYGIFVPECWSEEVKKTHFFITDIEFSERWEVVFDEDGYADDEYYDNWDVDTVEIDWSTLEFNLNGKWIKYEVEHESSTD